MPFSSTAVSIASMKLDGFCARSGSAFNGRACVRQQPVEPGADLEQGATEPPVGRRLNVTPGRKERECPAVDRGKNHFELALDDVVRLPDRVGVVAEDDQHGDVDREALEVVDDVEGVAARRRAPAGLQPFGDDSDARIKLTQMRCARAAMASFRCGRQASPSALNTPLTPTSDMMTSVVALRRNASGRARRAYSINAGSARRDNAFQSHPELKGRAVAGRPFLQSEMDLSSGRSGADCRSTATASGRAGRPAYGSRRSAPMSV